MWDDALLAVHANNPTRAYQAVQAMLNVGRSIGDEPTMFSQLSRAACGTHACNAAMRVLALTDTKQPIAELSEVQSAFLAEADEPLLLCALRGERAFWHLTLENLANGKLEAYVLAHGGQKEKQSVSDRLTNWFIRGFHSGGHAKFLELMTKAVNAAKLPPPEQTAALQAVEDEIHSLRSKRMGFGYRLVMLGPPMGKLANATLRTRAVLLAAGAGIACERFRLTRGRWPNTLEEIPKDILPAIPLDPFTGKPITLTKLKDGIAVYSAGSDHPERWAKGFGGDKPDTGPLGGSDIGCRLYDPTVRGLPPLPRKPKEDPFAPPEPKDEDKP
jgi:hypothetical protein